MLSFEACHASPGRPIDHPTMYLAKVIPIALLTTLAAASSSAYLEARGYTACQDAEMGLDRAIVVFSSRSNGLGAQPPVWK